MSRPLPAHETKHVPVLDYPFRNNRFHISQRDNGHTNGTALWLGAQCLSLYLADLYATKSKSSSPHGGRFKAVELGSGVGLTALALASLGWDVLATDLPIVIDTVLLDNVDRNVSGLSSGSGSICVRVLDWAVPPDKWTWGHPSHIAYASEASVAVTRMSNAAPVLTPPFQLIVTADTVYSPSLITPFLRTLHGLSTLSLDTSSANRSPPVYICLERRDPDICDRTLAEARDIWKFTVERVPHRKVQKSMKKAGLDWKIAAWEGIEIWKLVLQIEEQNVPM